MVLVQPVKKIKIGQKEPLNVAAPKINTTIDLVNNFQSQIDQIVVEGSIDPETAQARVDTDGDVHVTLKARLDEENSEVTSQLADLGENIAQRGINAMLYGLVGDGIVDDSQALINAESEAASLGRVLFIPPLTYRTTVPISFSCNVSAGGAVLLADHDESIALKVGMADNSVLFEKTIDLPAVIKSNKDWAKDCTGVQVLNANSCRIWVNKINNFKTGLHVAGMSQGNAYNDYFIRTLRNNKINLLLKCLDTTGWVNENNFHGGRYSHYTNEGVAVVGARHILMESIGNSINNNVFYKPSVEGDVAEYHIDLISCVYNMFISGRYEASSGNTSKVRLKGVSADKPSTKNVFMYGYNTQSLEVIEESYAGSNHVYSGDRLVLQGGQPDGTIIGSNDYSSSSPFMVILASTVKDIHRSDLSTKYSVAVGANRSNYKGPTDAFPRVSIEHASGVIKLGDGLSEPTFVFKNYGDAAKIEGENLYFDGKWDSSHIVLGTNHLWTDSLDKLRIKNTEPTSDTDGWVVGTQVS